jgi:hypothetical protein
VVIVLADGGLEDAASVEIVDDLSDAVPQPAGIGPILDQDAVPEGLVEIPRDALDLLRSRRGGRGAVSGAATGPDGRCRRRGRAAAPART